MKLLYAMLVSIISIASYANDYTPNELVIKMKGGKTLPQHSLIKSSRNLFGTVYVISTENLSLLENKLKNNNDIEYIQRNFRADKTPLPTPQAQDENISIAKNNSEFNDPQVNKIWSFDDARDYGVSVNSAYRLFGTTNTRPIIVAVVDTGIDMNHEDLKEVVWINENEIPGNKIDDDNNGYVDDIYGINTLIRDTQGKATSDNRDTHSHGTHVSGTIGAKQNNSKGIAGIAGNVKIMGIRTVPNSSDETDVDVAEAFIYAAKNGARIINCSFGKSSNEGRNLIPDTLKYIQDNYQVLVIAAAGNDSKDIDRRPTYPASHPNDNLLIVASTSSSGGMSGFSNYGKISVDVAAPGSSIYSTTPGNKYASMSGTSMASPTTAGVAAEILAHHPDLSALELKQILMNSVTKIERFKDKMVSGGRIDLLKGLELARSLKSKN